jgi:lactate dehydrogenase-like 2-hydroxyacid dehydrogenase
MTTAAEKLPRLLQMAPFIPLLEAGLAESFEVHKLFDIPDKATWFSQHGSSIVAVATGGHIGIPNEVADRLPSLQIVAVNGVGVDKVDLERARRHSCRVTNTPDVLTDDVADLAIGLTIALLRGIVPGHATVATNRWPRFEPPLGRKITGRQFGILGLGRIGQAVARRLEGFGARISYTDLVERPVSYSRHVNAVELARATNVLIVAAAAARGNQKLVNREVLDALGPSGYLVNVSRGSLVDEPALIEALQQRRLAGAALDVFANEPDVPTLLQQAPNVLLTPHIASATFETREAMARLVLGNLRAHFAGKPLITAVV